MARNSDTHVPLALQLLDAGIHTLVEKPVSTDAASGRVLVSKAATTALEGCGATVLVGQHRRFNSYIVGLASSSLRLFPSG